MCAGPGFGDRGHSGAGAHVAQGNGGRADATGNANPARRTLASAQREGVARQGGGFIAMTTGSRSVRGFSEVAAGIVIRQSGEVEGNMERFDSYAVELRCPDCGRRIAKTIGWLKLRRSLNCTSCGTLVKIDKESLLADVAKAEQALADLRKYFGKPSG